MTVIVDAVTGVSYDLGYYAVQAASSAAAAASSAASATAAAASVGAAATPVNTFTSIGSVTVPSGSKVVVTAGYTAAGTGGGVYVNDTTASASLAASYPAFCKADAAGRYWRLVGDYITAEQAGAVATAGINDQPAIQSAVNYAIAVGIKTVRFTKTSYELWCPTRTTSTGPGGATDQDGYPIIITNSAMALVGLPGGTTLNFKNSLGGNNSTITQTTAWGNWIGGGIFVNPNYTGATADIPYIQIENLTLAGTSTYIPGSGLNPPANTGSNLSDKGLYFPSNGTYGVAKLLLRNVTAYNFSGEIFYGGAFLANSTIVAENVELYNSNQSAWNPTGLGKVFATNLNAHDAYLPSELILGQGHTYINCRFANGSNAGCISTQYFAANYIYTYPNRDTTKEPTWCTYINTTFENIPVVNLSSWTRGSITAIDCSMTNNNWNDQDIYLDIKMIQDQWTTSRNSVTLAGPATLTTQYTGAPAGVYVTPPKNITLNVDFRRTATAKAAGGYADILTFSNLLDKDTIRISVTGEARNVISPFTGARPAGYGQPLVITDPAIAKTSGAEYFGGKADSPSANVAYDINWSALLFSPTGGGTYTVTINTNYTYAHGQLVTFFYKSGSGTMTFAPSGAGMKLSQQRNLAVAGDMLVLRYDATVSSWVEEKFVSARQLLFTGSKTYDAPSIAAGGTSTTTVTATGAALGDYVARVSWGVDLAGLNCTAYVSAANTVTVVLTNPTAGAIDLASTTLAVEVMKKVI